MKNLPEGMTPDKDNAVYFDPEKGMFYMIHWQDSETPKRYYIGSRLNASVNYMEVNIGPKPRRKRRGE